jgi:hypothetical protein
MNTKAKVLPLVILVAILAAVVIIFRSLTVLSTALLIGAGAFAFLHRDESADSRKLPWQSRPRKLRGSTDWQRSFTPMTR